MLSLPYVVFDFETNSLETHGEGLEIVGLGFSWKPGQAIYFVFPEGDSQRLWMEKFRRLFEDPSVEKWGQNLKYDCRVLDRFDIKAENIGFDTMLAHYCLFSDRMPHGLDDMVVHHLGHVKIRTKDVIPRKSKKFPNPSMRDAEQEVVSTYCCEDVDYTLRLALYLKELLDKPENSTARNLFYKYELPLLPVLVRMECNGVKIDVTALSKLEEEMKDRVEECEQEMEDQLGRRIETTNSRQIEDAVYNQLKIHEQKRLKVPKTKTGRRKTDSETLQTMKGHPYVKALLKVKNLNKLLSTYVLAIPKKISTATGLLHAWFHQQITATGRLSSSDPNLQNIPSRDQEGKKIRGAFVSRFEGGQILAVDYSQCELRILGHMSQEPVLLDAYRNSQDVHMRVATIIYGATEDQILPYQRNAAKTINFGLIYGMGPQRLARMLGIPIHEAEKIMNSYLGKLTKVDHFIKESAVLLKYYGYCETIDQRRRFISKAFSSDKWEVMSAEREATNHRVQGTNADIIKTAMISIHEMLEDQNLKSKMILQVHDEIVFDVHPEELDFLKDEIIKIMEAQVKLDVPMIADGRYADNWLEAH